MELKHTDPNAENDTAACDDELTWAHENLWTCCSGGQIDKRGMIFVVQTVMVFIVLIFSMIMVFTADEDTDYTVWVSIISAIVGNFLPTGDNRNLSNSK